MSSLVFVTADLHFSHRKVEAVRGIGWGAIVDRWNEVVTKRDVVYVLGDVFDLAPVCLLNGTKKLVLGNHDNKPLARYLDPGCFTRVMAMAEWDNCLLTHVPVHPGQRHRWRLNVHGHTHAHAIDDPWYRCASLEQTDYRPVLLSKLARR